jgi:hypothetical protein
MYSNNQESTYNEKMIAQQIWVRLAEEQIHQGRQEYKKALKANFVCYAMKKA